MNEKNSLSVPFAIIVAGVIIAASVIYVFSGSSNNTDQDVSDSQQEQEATETTAQPSPANILAVTQEDHIRGDINAPVKIVEFSDTECPYCKRFHETMIEALERYEGQVAWVYRHAPLDSLHSKARREAVATECAAQVGGNDGFWKYMDRLMEITPSNNQLDLALLPSIASDVGLDQSAFEACLADETFAQEKIQNQLEDAINSGMRGTPYSIVIAPNGKKFVINGAYPLDPVPGVGVTQTVDYIIKKALEETK